MVLLRFNIVMTAATLCLNILPSTNGLSNTATIFDMHTAVAPSQTVEQSSFVQSGVEIEMPDFDALFDRIQEVSPLAKAAINELSPGEASRVFDKPDLLTWKKIEENKKNVVTQVAKIDNYQNLGCPILRFRASLEGPCVGNAFASFIMDIEERSKWDPSINQVYEAYPIRDLDAANIQMGFGKYGDCSCLGVGYCQTKNYLAVSGREQLTLCGIQNFENGGAIMWGTEMEDWHNHLLPPGKRTTRARSHLFSTALVPTGDNTFDIEYCLQIDIGGNLPTWITTPVLTETVKNLFRHAKHFFKNEDSKLEMFIKEHESKHEIGHGILMTP
eukprot:CAMPEP_0178895896 /NCGR_PEP_ID=MMETSP0786-20121207/845_1 /TAXON_ID=186022 /ORGANISM="Thalassionema frauenfeldii, Strain CCMP 1798" /LENGTH=329 /DNA_ID=CAMNT_0020566185 /DNA_START=93 /DNA_END=1082 /DNA_ORIENTATION=-